MKKLIGLLLIVSLLSGCTPVIGTDSKNIEVEYDGGNSVYINKDFYKLIDSMEELRKESIKKKVEEGKKEEDTYYYYTDLSGVDPEEGLEIYFTNDVKEFDEDYYYSVLEIFDKNISPGIRDYIEEWEDKDIEEAQVKKIGKSVVVIEKNNLYADNSLEETTMYKGDAVNLGLKNTVEIMGLANDPKDKDYEDLVDKIFKEEYVLKDLVTGGKKDYIYLVNPYKYSNVHGLDRLKLSYNLYLEDKKINKLEIIGEKIGEGLEDVDIEVFERLIDRLGVGGEEKIKIVENFKNSFNENKSIKKLENSDYTITSNIKKYVGSEEGKNNLIYFTIKKK